MNRFETLIGQCDADIRNGRPQEAANRIAQIEGAKIPREYLLPLAKICRRTGLLSTGLRLLAKLINHKRSAAYEATPAELAEYAVLLLRSGAVSESLERLQAIDAAKVPDALLFRAYAHFARWEYAESLPSLEKYLQANLPPQPWLVGRTNLAFALTECRRHERALQVVEENTNFARAHGFQNLELFNHALRGQIHLQEGDFVRARLSLERAQPKTPAQQTHDQFFAHKLRLILDGLESQRLEPIDQLRRAALARRDWFAVREADLFGLKINFRQELFSYLYFGSPLRGFRDCIQMELGRTIDQTTYVFGDKNAPCFDLTTGTLDGRKVSNPGGKCHQLLNALLLDFYQPPRIAGLHSELYPGQHFNVLSSPDRVRQVIHRTRDWLKASGYPVAIHENRGFYSLHMHSGFSFRIALERDPIDHFQLQMHALKSAFQTAHLFSTKDICGRLGISITTAHRLLKRGIETRQIERLGSTKRPLGYRLLTTEHTQHSKSA